MSDNVNLEMGSMPSLLERHWPKLALLLTLALFAGLLFAPAHAQGFATPFIVLTLGMGILLLAACALWAVVLARFVGGRVAEFVGVGYGRLLG